MTLTLRLILDDIVAPSSGGIGRYTEELARQLIETAPDGCEVAGVVSSSPERDYETIATRLPGLADLFKSALARREMQLAWQHGVTRLPGGGMIHATSLLAPLSRHDRVNDASTQTVVTMHDAIAWTHPHAMPARRLAWHKAMAKRAHRFADAVVVPTHSVAHDLAAVLDFGDRIRVIPGAVSSKLTLPVDADARAEKMDLPERFVLTAGTLDDHKGIVPLIRSLASEADAGLPLLIAGPRGRGGIDVQEIAAAAGLEDGRVRSLGFLSDADLAVALDRATVFAYPSLAEGFGLPMVEAFHFGTPVVHSDAAALVEVAAGAGIIVPIGEPASQVGATEDGPADGHDPEYPDRLAEAIASVVNDDELAERLRYSGIDRARAFSWRDSARQIWQLHADI